MGLICLKPTGFMDRRVDTGVGNQLFLRWKAMDVANLGKDDGPIDRSNTGNRGDRRVKLLHIGLDFLIQECNDLAFEITAGRDLPEPVTAELAKVAERLSTKLYGHSALWEIRGNTPSS